MSAIYPKFKEALLSDTVGNLTAANIKVALLSSAYTYNAAHDHLDDLTGIVATSGNLTGITVTNGTLDAANVTITGVSGSAITQAVFYVDSGVAGASKLITNITGLSLTPDGGNIDVTINSIAIL